MNDPRGRPRGFSLIELDIEDPGALKNIYASYGRDREAHKPCAQCERAHRKQEMCEVGRARYVAMLHEIDVLLWKRFLEQQQNAGGSSEPGGER
jgi:hypothetical protein